MNPFDQYRLCNAVYIYQNHNSDSSKDYYLEGHKISYDPVTHKPVLLDGKPLQYSTIRAIAKKFANNSIFNMGHVPAGLLYAELDTKNIVWHVPAAQRRLLFHKSLNIQSGLAYCPALLFAYVRSKLYVFALKSNARPKANTKLFEAPFHNVHPDGAVCTGNAKFDADNTMSVSGLIELLEKVFFVSEFSHFIGQRPIIANTDIGSMWKILVGSQATFPRESLIQHPVSKTLGGLYKKIL